MAESFQLPKIHIYRAEQPELCDTMWENCRAQAPWIVIEDFGTHTVPAARCPRHLKQELPQVDSSAISINGVRSSLPRLLQVIESLLVLFLLCSTGLAASRWQTGRLAALTDSRSNRAVGNSQTGSVVNVTDVEYRISVQLENMIYVGSYWPRTVWSYEPTDFIVNDPIEVRIDGKHMFVKRPNGKELKTTIIQRTRVSDSQK